MTDISELMPDGCRALFSAVVNAALEDLREEPYGSTDYEQSISFFFGHGEWAMWRTEVADMLNLHSDDLSRSARRVLNARALRDPPPPPKPRATPEAKPPLVRLATPVYRAPVYRAPVVKARVIEASAIKPPATKAPRPRPVPAATRWRRDNEPRGAWLRRFSA